MKFKLKNTCGFRGQRFAIIAFLASLAAWNAQAGNLDSALTDLVASYNAGQSLFTNSAAGFLSLPQPGYGSLAITDDQGRILVDIHLDGTSTIDQVSASLVAAGGVVTGANPDFQNGTLSAFIPLSAIQSTAATSGIKLINMTSRPAVNVGKVTSQGAKVMRSDVANASGFTGSGITVGVLSDSYDKAPASFFVANPPGVVIRASDDIASGDLPTPKFVTDFTGNGTDEGRAMMQIIYDVAPQSSLCFATADAGEAAFASNIRLLRTNAACRADVIVDDVFYFDEPFFSDGQVAQAVNDVVTSTVLAGKPVAYFSSAGNFQSQAYSVPTPATFSTTPAGIGNINLGTIGTCLAFTSPVVGNTAADAGGGFLDFGGGNYAPALTLTGNGQMILQWDDLFYQGKVTTDLNFYFFNSAGNCLFAIAANNIATTDNGFEFIGVNSSGTTVGRMMIGRTSAGTKLASRVRLLSLGGFSSPLFGSQSQPASFGHSSAANAISVAAYRYSVPFNANPFTPALEPFSSPGPATIAFDGTGTRLDVPETRKKPDLAAPDGGDTTFFYPGSDPDGDGFPNFFGTSAAAPHAAGVAALMLQKAGGPGTLTAQQIKSYMETSAPARIIPYSGLPAKKGWSIYDGYGLIDAVAALAKIL